MSSGSGAARVSEVLLVMVVPVALMAGALAMQRLEHHLLGPAPSSEEHDVPRRAPAPYRPAS